MPSLSIPATFRLIPAKQSIPPPPPYHASVRSAIHRNEINQITTQIQQSCSTNVFNAPASSSSTLITNINAIDASSSAVHVDEDSDKRLEESTTDTETYEQEKSNADEIATSNDFDKETEHEHEHALEHESETSPRSEGDDKELENGNETPSEGAGRSCESLKQRPNAIIDITTNDPAIDIANKQSRNFKEETADSRSVDAGNASDRKKNGLKVLSNVQVSPNAILNMSMKTTISETIPLNSMIIVSSIPSTSTGTTSQALPIQLVSSKT